MLFKWVRFCLNLYDSFRVCGNALGSVTIWVCVALFYAPVEGYAYFNIEPANGGSLAGSINTQLTVNPTFNYFVQIAGVPAIPTYAANRAFITFNPLDPSTLPPGAQSIDDKMFQISVSSTASVTNTSGSQTAVLMFYAYPTSGGTPVAAPIAAVNGIPCGLAGSNCIGQNAYVYDPTYQPYYGVIYPGLGRALTIGFYPAQICRDAANQNVTIQGCTGGALSPQVNGAPLSLQIVFAIGYSPDGRSIPASGSFGSVDQMATPLTLTFQTEVPSLACPNPVSSAYLLPGDGVIFMNTALFGMPRPSTQDANPANLIVVGQDQLLAPGVAPVVDETFRVANTFVQNVTFASSQTVPGFTNSTLAERHVYKLSFLALDYAGIYVAPDPGQCILDEVQTADIQGFLEKGNCFIATASFRSYDAAPVQLLRKFRNQILLNSKIGKAVVSVYNRWSPPASDWLMRHPVFRYPVLLALAPVEIAVWFCLHPLLFLSLSIIIGMCSVIFIQGRNPRTRKFLE